MNARDPYAKLDNLLLDTALKVQNARAERLVLSALQFGEREVGSAF